MFKNGNGAVEPLETGIAIPDRERIMERKLLSADFLLKFPELLVKRLDAFGIEFFEHQGIDRKKSFRDVPRHGRNAFPAQLHSRHGLSTSEPLSNLTVFYPPCQRPERPGELYSNLRPCIMPTEFWYTPRGDGMEKRSQNRSGKRLFVKFGKDKPDKLGFTEDVSTGGMFIKSNTVLQPGVYLQIELTLPDHRVLLMTGQVMWARQVPPSLLRFAKKSGMGIRLTQVNNDYQQYIDALGTGTRGPGS